MSQIIGWTGQHGTFPVLSRPEQISIFRIETELAGSLPKVRAAQYSAGCMWNGHMGVQKADKSKRIFIGVWRYAIVCR